MLQLGPAFLWVLLVREVHLDLEDRQGFLQLLKCRVFQKVQQVQLLRVGQEGQEVLEVLEVLLVPLVQVVLEALQGLEDLLVLVDRPLQLLLKFL